MAVRYVAERELGRGGMGVVELVDDKVTGRHVARKRLAEGEVEILHEDRERFEREALVHAQLEHPSIVPVYDIGRNEDGTLYFTMKRVEGESLASIFAVRDVRYTRRRLLAAFSQVCLAAHFAHERGIIHRDIKPANIMLGRYGEVYLLDWGIAKLLGKADIVRTPRLGGRPNVTEAGMILGTLSSMAPEQLVGEEIDARTDVYALGAVLFELLTFEPFHPRGEFDDVATAILDGVEARASVRFPDSNVPPELEAICVQATRPTPADRTPSAQAMHDAIELYLDGDRDLELRRAEAERLLTRAKKTPRSEALRDVGRALAFEPSNPEALATLVNLLTTPPAEVPREVKAAMHESLLANIRRGGRAGLMLFGGILAFSFATLIPVGAWHQLGVEQLCWLGAAVSCGVAMRRPSVAALAIAFLFGITATTLVTNNYSAMAVVPAVFSVHALLFALVRGWQRRWFFIGVTTLAWTLAFFGSRSGLFEGKIVYLDHMLCVHSPLMTIPPAMMSVHLYASTLIAIIVPAIVVGIVREAMNRSDERMRLFTWQLKQLIPEKEAVVSEPTTLTAPR